ncbi:MAG: nylA [Acidimicrobiales bacterium]|nr:nylA [Acidimicrobiales bacterium]
MADDLARMDATTQAELVRTGTASAAELVDAAIARIEQLNPELNAVIHPLYDKARRQASGELPVGPFTGVPMVVKDLTCHTAGDPFHEGMKFLKEQNWVEDEDTFLAAKFRAAGFVFVGKTNTPELGIVPTTEPQAYGATRNPWNTAHSTGGSSGGSAAAVASGMVPVGHANDGGGSIRIPASECGLVGLKPTRGRNSLGPDYGDVFGGLVHEHVVTRSVRDTAAVLDAVHGSMPGDPYAAPTPSRPFIEEVGADPGRLRIGMTTSAPPPGTHPDCVAAVDAAARLLESLGHTVEAEYPKAMDDPEVTTQFITFWSAGNAWGLDYWERKTGTPIGAADVEPLTWALCEMGRSYTAPQWLSAREWLQRWTREMAEWWNAGYDLLLTPTIAEPPPPLGDFDSPPDNPLQGLFRAAGLVPFTPAFNITGQPAISLPLAWNAAGLPIGVQLVSAFGREDVLLRVSAQLEAAQPWADRMPPLHAS